LRFPIPEVLFEVLCSWLAYGPGNVIGFMAVVGSCGVAATPSRGVFLLAGALLAVGSARRGG
jgi:hypothetical protein